MRRIKTLFVGLLALSLVSCSNAPYIGENGHWWVNGSDLGVAAKGEAGADGKPGADGKDGKDAVAVTVVSVTFDRTEGNKDHFKIVFSDGSTQSFYTTHGSDGGDGTNGVNGQTPEIKNGTWWIGGVDSGVSATGQDGQTVTIESIVKSSSEGLNDTYKVSYSDGNSFFFTITNGKDGLVPYVGTNGNWWIGDDDMDVYARGVNGNTPYIGDNGNWWIEDQDTGVLADSSKLKEYDATNGLKYGIMTLYGQTGVVVTGYSGDDKDVYVPSFVGVLPVIGIGPSAFKDLSIEHVYLPSTAKFAASQAFSNCTDLISVSAPGLEETGYRAFYGCNSLNSLAGPKLKKVGTSSFEACKLLSSVDFSEIEFIDDRAFVGCENLETLHLPSSLTTLGNHAFDACKNLVQIDIDDGVSAIGSYAFATTGITSLIVPNSVTAIGYAALNNTPLEELSIPFVGRHRGNPTPSDVEKMAYGAGYEFVFGHLFERTQSTDVTSGWITQNVMTWKVIGDYTYISGESTYVNRYRIPSSLKKVCITDETFVKAGAFSQLYSLTNVTYSNPLTTVQQKAFNGCSNLSSIPSLDGVTALGNSAFAGTAITSVTIPSSVTTIGVNCFNCNKLAEAYFEAKDGWSVSGSSSTLQINEYLLSPGNAATLLKSTMCDKTWNREKQF